MRPVVVTAGPLANASANAICLTQTPTVGALTLNGALVTAGVATLDALRRVLFTFAADETGHSFVVTGTNGTKDTISETVAGTTAGTVATVLSYRTVISITISANATGALTVGTNGVGESPWVRLDSWALPPIMVQCDVTGTVNYTVQTTLDDPNGPTNAVAVASMSWLNFPDTNLQAQTATAQGQIQNQPTWLRCVLNSGTGTVTMTANQPGSVSY